MIELKIIAILLVISVFLNIYLLIYRLSNVEKLAERRKYRILKLREEIQKQITANDKFTESQKDYYTK